ncbi:MAG: DUF885 domain-containing protein [Polyangiaceae bacterium]|nr:DUF885 domain-containing protein [Polyangiaceae bacterium]
MKRLGLTRYIWPALLLPSALFVPSCGSPPVPKPSETIPKANPAGWACPLWLPKDAGAGTSNERLAQLLKQEFESELKSDPLWASDLGVTELQAELPDHSRAALAAWRGQQRSFLAEAQKLKDDELSPEDRLTKRLFVEMLSTRVAGFVCKSEYWSIDARSNPLVNLNRLPELAKLTSLASGKDLLERYRGVSGLVDQEIANLKVGLNLNLVTSRAILERVIKQYRTELAKQLDTWPLYKAADELPEEWPADERAELGRKLRHEVERQIRPAYTRFVTFLERELLPKTRDGQHEGISALSVGKVCYEAEIRRHTTLELSADQLHQLGKDELNKIHKEIVELGGKVFSDQAKPEDINLAFIQGKLRDDPALFFNSAQEIQDAANAALKRAQAEVPQVFGRRPKAPCVVRPIPDYEAPFSPIAYYRPPEPGGGKPGEYFVNLLNPPTRPRYEAEVLAFHESVPGHHLQIAIAQELPELPAFRKHAYNTAYVEGWGLYSERLAAELGLYSDDLSRLGMLSFDTWRASRLVVDTGLHAKGWTRKQAEDFMFANTMLAKNNIENEVDRYISWPGQALAYKVGQLRILALRKEAEQALGAKFKLSEFHDVVLGEGPLPLPVLSEQVHAWITKEAGATAPASK